MSAMFSGFDHAMMARALRLAERGLYTTAPNPRVGCVLVRDGDLVGEGWHARAGEAHAEVHALNAASTRARGSTAYVTLEPCAHQGRTPPCADALIAAGIQRVVIAAEDPFPQVNGAGLIRMRNAGIQVETGLMRDAACEINRGFFSRIERQRPWIRVKLAQSLDGRTGLANGQSHWITGSAARADVQHWRARSSAILTASGTARIDRPRLTVRLPDAQEFVAPLRVVLDAHLDALTPGDALLDPSAATLIVHGPGATPAHPGYAAIEHIDVAASGSRLDLHAVMAVLAAREINELQVEAGAVLSGALFDAGLVDEVLLYIAPTVLGDTGRPLLRLPTLSSMDERWGLRLLDQRYVGDDLRLLLRRL